MHYYEVAPNQLIRAGSATFTYGSDSPLSVGTLVSIEVGKKSLVGVVIREVKKPIYATKAILSVIESQPLPAALVSTALWISDYYATPLSSVLQTLLPRGLQKNRRQKQTLIHQSRRDRITIVFNPEQLEAIQTVDRMSPGSALLHGVTGSGKTHVYIELAKRTLEKGKSVIILVPEIALTSQLLDEFSHHFTDILLTHSRQTEAQRHLVWQEALYSITPRIIIGPRSALFMPIKEVGLIVVDEAHEPSFKQEQSPRYSALRVASILGKYNNAKVIFGSATPSIADYFLAEKSKRPIIHMITRAQKDTVAPTISLIDMTKRASFKNHRFISDHLIKTIASGIENGHQALIFHNRRGSASTTLCEACGWAAMCPRCFVPFTLHADKHMLQCHICGQHDKVPTNCPICHSVDIIHKGIGTKLIETELRKLFPNKNIVRFDGDSELSETVEQKYKELYDGTIDIIVGTQVIAKGLDLPKLRTVGVIQADAGLALPDFNASERTFQLLAQVVGRVGRSHHPTDVVIQSYQPTHPAVVDGLNQDYEHFYRSTLAIRRQALFPPFTYLLKLTCIYKTEAAAIRNARQLGVLLKQNASPSTQVLGPTPAFYERQHDTYRWQLTVKSPSRADLLALLQYLPPAHWQFELDPTSLL
jgi:primosomal protein N' (replication factor Y)